VIKLDGIHELEEEIFGPVLHVATFEAHELDQVVDQINAQGFGLTFGLHTRVDKRVERIVAASRSAISTSTATRSAPSSAPSPSAAKGSRAPGPRRAGRINAPAGALHGDTLDRAFTTLAAPADALDRLARAVPDHPALAAAAAFPRAPRDLPGPTGESNRLSLHPRGRVLCLGAGAADALAQAIQALAAGNTVLMVAANAPDAAAPLIAAGLPVTALDGQADPAALTALPGLALVAARGPEDWLRSLRRALARREGPIVPLETSLIAPERYVIERHLCIDTTAAGGNASLLAATA
jgi:RHH-type transcriptional regulator, proline utilization regulon repressor / proline dehydrogenase / delta 1-pyrroline-5-carboxylate dehydrogenase